MVAGTGTNYLDGLPAGIEKVQPIVSSSQQEDGEGTWLRILQEVSARNNNAVRGSLIVLGNERSGKTSLLGKLMGGNRKPLNSALEYSYMQIHADASASYAYQLGGGANGLLGPTDSATLPVWVLDGREEMMPMLRFAFPPTLAKCVIVLCASLEQPGNVLPTLRRWYRMTEVQLKQFYAADEIFQAQQAQVRFWQEYVEPIESSLHHSTITLSDTTIQAVGGGNANGDQGGGASPLLLPPEKGILEENCGASLFVVITKSDLHTEFSSEQLDKVQYHVRQFCLRHGATLIYTSAKDDLNTQMLHKYIAHRVYALPFTTPAYIVERDRIFVPMGWDSDQKLSIIKESLGYGTGEVPMLAQQADVPFPFSPNKSSNEREIEADDEQTFLNKLASMSLDFGGSGGGGGGEIGSGGGAVGVGQMRAGGQQSPRQGGAVKGPAIVGGGQPGENNNTMLANFFSSLLTKDTQRPSSTHSNKSGGSPALPSSSVDAEMHFQKMLTTSTAQKQSSIGQKSNQLEQEQQPESEQFEKEDVEEEGAGEDMEEEEEEVEEENSEEEEEEFEDAPEGDDANN